MPAVTSCDVTDRRSNGSQRLTLLRGDGLRNGVVLCTLRFRRNLAECDHDNSPVLGDVERRVVRGMTMVDVCLCSVNERKGVKSGVSSGCPVSSQFEVRRSRVAGGKAGTYGIIRCFLLVRGAGAVMSGGRQVAPGRPGCGVRGGAARVGVPRVRYFLPLFFS